MPSSRSDTPEASLLSGVSRVARVIAAGLAGGVVAGAVAGGLGSRLLMRVIGVMARSHYGEVTHENSVVGETTFAGTLNLVIQGAGFGLFGGVVYLLVRRWMPGRRVVKGLTFGVFLLLFQGTLVLDGNYEYYRYISPWQAYAMFALLFPAYGVVLALVAETLAGPSPWPNRRLVTRIGYAVVSLIAIAGTADLVTTMRELLVSGA